MPGGLCKGAKARDDTVIAIGLGANLPSAEHGAPRATLEAALEMLGALGAPAVRRSRWYRSPPLADPSQPWFVNGVAALETGLAPLPLLALLHEVERRLDRVRRVRWEARVIDLDLLAYHDLVVGSGEAPGGLVLPHPRLHERAFVLRPLAEVAPLWRHPALGRTVAELLSQLPGDQFAEPLVDARRGGSA